MNTKNQINDGGPAFPILRSDQAGMSLRDWFAGQALAGLVANIGPKFWAGDAENVYDIADAMLAASNQTKP